MNINIKNLDKYIAKFAPIIFIVLTLLISLIRTPFYDETHAQIISQLKLSEIFYLSRIEGHPILWYLILKPFNLLNLYPYPMMIINWFFASAMILVFWKKAPFNTYIKLLLTFSYPFFHYFGTVSRPYTLGVLVIFLLCAFYKNSTKRPLLYSFLLILCANISVITCFIATSFGILFLFDIFKNKKMPKKDIIITGTILLFGIITILAQFLFVETPKMQSANAHQTFLKHLSYFIYRPFSDIADKNINQIILQLITSISFFYYSFIFFRRDKKTLFFCLTSICLMILFFSTIYIGDFWHYFFFLIIFICSLWIIWDKIKHIKLVNFLFILLILCNMSSYSITQNGKNRTNEPIFYTKTLDIITKTEKLKNAKLFYFNHYTHVAPGLLLYLKKEGITLYDNHNNDRTSFEAIRNIQNAEYKILDPEEFIQYLDKTKINYLLANSNQIADYSSFDYSEGNYKIYFDLEEYHPELYLLIYKLRYEKL